MKYINALKMILNGIKNDNATMINDGCFALLDLTGSVCVTDVEREIAAHLLRE